MPRKYTPLSERFNAHVDRSGGPDACWIWHGATKDGGYGKMGHGGRDGRTVLATHVAWELQHGPVPPGMKVCHTCDNPPCCNPQHLFLGTQAINMADMTEKGRRVRGESVPAAKLTEERVREIRQRYAAGGVTYASLAAEYSVGERAIQKVVRRINWQHVT